MPLSDHQATRSPVTDVRGSDVQEAPAYQLLVQQVTRPSLQPIRGGEPAPHKRLALWGLLFQPFQFFSYSPLNLQTLNSYSSGPIITFVSSLVRIACCTAASSSSSNLQQGQPLARRACMGHEEAQQRQGSGIPQPAKGCPGRLSQG